MKMTYVEIIFVPGGSMMTGYLGEAGIALAALEFSHVAAALSEGTCPAHRVALGTGGASPRWCGLCDGYWLGRPGGRMITLSVPRIGEPW